MIYVVLAIAGPVVLYAVGLPVGGLAVGIIVALITAIRRALQQRGQLGIFRVFRDSRKTLERYPNGRNRLGDSRIA